MEKSRSAIISMLGHVDHGKTTILDSIRGSAIVKTEAGKITQAIGASIIPSATIKKICGDLLDKLKIKLTISGLLFIDTPGHAAFTNIRKRGGNLADIAILVVDINEGVKPQTIECIEILKSYKTPFIIAANKIDLISGWKSSEKSLLGNINKLQENIRNLLDKKLYELVGKLSEFGFESERFDRIEDHTKQIAIIPTSAKSGDGIPELLMVLAGLTQKYLEKCLKCDVTGRAKGTILEVKEEKGLGITLDTIIYDGCLRQNDILVIGSLKEPIVTKVKALFEPAPLKEMRDKKSKFKSVKHVSASTGVKISAPGTEDVVAGMPIRSCSKEDVEKVKEEIQKEVEEVLIKTDEQGIVIKADSLGSLEALMNILKEKNIPVVKASIGDISKKDISDALSIYEKNPLQSVVLGFNVTDKSGICNENVKIITDNVIYKLIEEFEKWQENKKRKMEEEKLDLLVRPAKIQLMKGYVFRQNNPAVCGMDILAGTLKVGTPLMDINGKELTSAKSIQKDQENLEKAEKGKQVAVSMERVTVGRQINEGDILLSSVPESHFKKMKELKKYLSDEEKGILKEIAKIKRKNNPVWGV